MPTFEVYIPAKDANAMNVTLQVDAENWVGALRTGLANIGEGQDAISNVMCDIKPDNSIHVTNPATNRVFRLKELKAGAPALAVPPPTPQAAPAPAPQAAPAVPPPTPQAAPQAAPAKTAKQHKTKGKGKKVERKKAPAPPPQRASGQFQAAPGASGRAESKPMATDPAISVQKPKETIDMNDVIADVFDLTSEMMMEGEVEPQMVAKRMLDIAMEKVSADAGTFYLSDLNGHELSFAAVRGPKADALKKSGKTVRMGQGIIGFAAQEGICLVVQDMQNDTRYFSGIADAIGYQPTNTLCASAEKDGRLFGAIQLINAKDGSFSEGEMEVIRYIGLTAADMLERFIEAHTEIGI